MSVQQDTVNIQQTAVERDVQQILAHIDFYDWRYPASYSHLCFVQAWCATRIVASPRVGL
jgi:hypothetical protein